MKAYKGFNSKRQCRGFQFEEGKTYEEPTAILCDKGFHACEAPLDVFGYYPPVADDGTLNKYHEVELEEVLEEKSDDTKRVAKKIKIGAELNIFNLVKAHVEYVKEHVEDKKEDTGDYSAVSNTGDYSAASNTGYRSAASNTGYRSAASNTGDYSAASNTGDRSAASNTGDYSAASNTGYRSAASNTGYRSAASNTGDYSAASNTGYRSAASNTGDYSAASNTGYRSAASNTGDRSAASNTGDYSAASNTGVEGIAVAWGVKAKAKGAKGCYIVLSEWGDYDYANNTRPLKCAKMFKVDGKKIKADTFYKLVEGKPVEVE